MTDEYGHVPIECRGCDHGCMFCVGGLYGCSVCGGLEGGMPTSCPGEMMSEELVSQVHRGERDFRDRSWIDGCAPWSPARWSKPFLAIEKKGFGVSLRGSLRELTGKSELYPACEFTIADSDDRFIGIVKNGVWLEEARS